MFSLRIALYSSPFIFSSDQFSVPADDKLPHSTCFIQVMPSGLYVLLGFLCKSLFWLETTSPMFAVFFLNMWQSANETSSGFLSTKTSLINNLAMRKIWHQSKWGLKQMFDTTFIFILVKNGGKPRTIFITFHHALLCHIKSQQNALVFATLRALRQCIRHCKKKNLYTTFWVKNILDLPALTSTQKCDANPMIICTHNWEVSSAHLWDKQGNTCSY